MSSKKRPEDADPDATVVHRPGAGADEDATVVHRPAPDEDPEQTVLHRPGADPDADATVAYRPGAPAPDDPDATVVHRPDAGRPVADDPDATVMHPAGSQDPDATVMHPAAKHDPDATVMQRTPAEDPDATVVRRAPPGEADADPEATGKMPAPPAQASGAAAEPDPEASVILPTPGRRAPAPAPAAAAAESFETGPVSAFGLNPLVAAANPLLGAVPQFRWTLTHPDPGALRQSLGARLEQFQSAAAAAGVSAATVESARAALCALIDEAVQSTPWGAASDWTTQTLAHAAGTGAQDFFDALEALEADPGSDTDLLELMSVCLALGYEGRFRNAPNGRIALSQARERVSELIRSRRGPTEALPLSVHWEGVQTTRRALPRALALWVTASLCALVLGASYLAYRTILSGAAQPVYAELARLKAKPAEHAPTAAAPAGPVTRLSALLASQIKAGAVQVTEDARASTVTISATELFASGSGSVVERYEKTILEVAAALDGVAGPVTVTGHTDSRPIRTARFPSNWELSRARAESVVQLMAKSMKQPGRLRAEGVADSEPVAPNDTEANRRLNRRVVIVLEARP